MKALLSNCKSLTVVATLGLLLTLVSPAFSATKAACATMSMTPSSTTITRGQALLLSGSITSCAVAPEVIQVRSDLLSPAGTHIASNTTTVKLQPGQTTQLAITLPVRSTAPVGSYTLNSGAFSAGVQVATAQSTIIVQ